MRRFQSLSGDAPIIVRRVSPHEASGSVLFQRHLAAQPLQRRDFTKSPGFHELGDVDMKTRPHRPQAKPECRCGFTLPVSGIDVHKTARGLGFRYAVRHFGHRTWAKGHPFVSRYRIFRHTPAG